MAKPLLVPRTPPPCPLKSCPAFARFPLTVVFVSVALPKFQIPPPSPSLAERSPAGLAWLPLMVLSSTLRMAPESLKIPPPLSLASLFRTVTARSASRPEFVDRSAATPRAAGERHSAQRRGVPVLAQRHAAQPAGVDRRRARTRAVDRERAVARHDELACGQVVGPGRHVDGARARVVVGRVQRLAQRDRAIRAGIGAAAAVRLVRLGLHGVGRRGTGNRARARGRSEACQRRRCGRGRRSCETRHRPSLTARALPGATAHYL